MTMSRMPAGLLVRLTDSNQGVNFTEHDFASGEIAGSANHFHIANATKIVRRHAFQVEAGFSNGANRRQGCVDTRIGFLAQRLQVFPESAARARSEDFPRGLCEDPRTPASARPIAAGTRTCAASVWS